MKPAVETATRAAFAEMHGVSRMTVSRWLARGCAVLVSGTDRINVAQSNALLAARLPVYRGGKARDKTRHGDELVELHELEEWDAILLAEVLTRLRAAGLLVCTHATFDEVANCVLAEWAASDQVSADMPPIVPPPLPQA
jgi:hypothetical protein